MIRKFYFAFDKIFRQFVFLAVCLLPFTSVCNEMQNNVSLVKRDFMTSHNQESSPEECVIGALGNALAIKNIINQFRQIFDEFAQNSSQEVKIQILEQFVALCARIVAIDLSIDEQDKILCSKYIFLEQHLTENYNQEIQDVSKLNLNFEVKHDQLASKFSQLSVVSDTSVDQLCTQLNYLQKNINSSLLACSHDLAETFIVANAALNDQLGSVAQEVNAMVSDFCLLFNAVKTTIDTQAAEQASSFNAKLAIKQKQLFISIAALQDSLITLLTRQLSGLSADLVINQTKICSKIASLAVGSTQSAQELALDVVLLGQAVAVGNSSIDQAFVILSDMVSRAIDQQELRLSLALGQFADQFNMILDLFEAGVQTRLVKQLAIVSESFMVNSSLLGSKIAFLEEDIECAVKEKLTESQLLIGQSIAKLTLKIAALDANVLAYTADIKAQISCLDAQLRSEICKKFSIIDTKQLAFGQEITDQLAYMYNHLSSLSSSKISHLQRGLGDQNNIICSQLASYNADANSIITQAFVNNECIEATYNAVLCSKIGSFQAQTSELIITKLSTFAKDVAIQDNVLCSKIGALQINLDSVISTEFSTALASIDQSVLSYCEKIATTEDNLESQYDKLCSKIKNLDIDLVTFVNSQSDSVQSAFDALLGQINALVLYSTSINVVFGLTAAGIVSPPVAS